MKILRAVLIVILVANLLPLTAFGSSYVEVVPCMYSDVSDFSEGFASVTLKGKCGYIDKNGEEVIPLKYSKTLDFSEDFALVRIDGKWGYIDKTGEEITPLKYAAASDFSGGFARVGIDGKYGYIDETGEEVIPLKYNAASSFSEGVAVVGRAKTYYFINKTGRETHTLNYDEVYNLSEGISAVVLHQKKGNLGTMDFFEMKLGYIDKTGKEILPCKYELVGPPRDFHDGMAAVKFGGERGFFDGKWGFIDKTGREVISPIYNQALDFSEGFAAVELGGKWGFVDKTGEAVIPLEYTSGSNFSEGLAAIKRDGQWRYIDKTGAEVISLKYANVSDFSEGFAAVKLNGKWGFIDKTGNEAVPLKYDEVRRVSEGIAAVKLNDKWGFISVDNTSADASPEAAEAQLLSDKPSLWATADVTAAISANLVAKSLQSKYTQATTRAEFCSLVVTLYETVTGVEIQSRQTFDDTKDVNVEKAASLKIALGTGDDEFSPDTQLTREQAAVMLTRLAEVLGKPFEKKPAGFDDNSSISPWAIEAVGQVRAAGIMSGLGDNIFSPKSPYTREQSIITILRLFNEME